MAVIIPTLRSPAARNPQPVVEGRRQDPLGHLVGDYGACMFLYQTPILALYEDGGGSYADTLPELAACRIWGGGATVMDWASHRWIVFATPAHGGIATLYACESRDWPAISGANMVLALHTTTRTGWRRYQPRGTGGTVRIVSDANDRALSLHTAAPPEITTSIVYDANDRAISLHAGGTPSVTVVAALSGAGDRAISLHLPSGTTVVAALSDGTDRTLSLYTRSGTATTVVAVLSAGDDRVLSLHTAGTGTTTTTTAAASDAGDRVLSLHTSTTVTAAASGGGDRVLSLHIP